MGLSPKEMTAGMMDALNKAIEKGERIIAYQIKGRATGHEDSGIGHGAKGGGRH